MKPHRVALALLALALLPARAPAQEATPAAPETTPAASATTTTAAAAEPTEDDRLAPLTSEQQTRLCDQAAALLESGYAADAEALYKALLGRAPCAKEGAEAAAAQQKEDAAAATRSARKSRSACTVGRAFERAGRESDAEAAYKKAVEANAARCAVTALKRLDEKEFDEQADDVLKTATKLLGAGAALAGLALLLGYTLGIVLGRIWVVRAVWPLSRIRRPSLQVDALDEEAADKKLGKATATLIRGRIAGPRRYRTSLTVVSGQASIATSLAGLSDLNAQLKAVVTAITILDRALPRRRFRLEGVLQPKQSVLGVGVSVALEYNDRPCGGSTHWATAYGMPANVADADGYRRLTVPSAAWAEHKIALELGARRLITSDSLSYALLQAGLERLAENERAEAKELYEAARARDTSNIGAMVNLGLLEAQEQNDTAAEEFFEEARRRLEAYDL